MVVVTLKKVCKSAILIAGLLIGINIFVNTPEMLTSPNIVTPITLNIRWITAVRRAFVLVPTDAISDVIHVPILLPKLCTALDQTTKALQPTS